MILGTLMGFGAGPDSGNAEPWARNALKPTEPGRYASFSPEGDIRRFAGETLYYDIDFMFFSRAATASLTFFEKDGTYQALLVAETRGFLGFLTSHVRHSYRSTFEILEGGRRLRTLSFEREITVGGDRERIVHALDHGSLLHRMRLYRNQGLVQQFTRPLPAEESLDDVLGAFYNTRNAAYGRVAKGRKFDIPTFWTREQNQRGQTREVMSIHILSDAERRRVEREELGLATDAPLLVNMKVPSDLYETRNGEIYYWSSDHFIPTEAVYRDFILFGDLRVRLVRREYHPRRPERGQGAAPVQTSQTGRGGSRQILTSVVSSSVTSPN